MTNGAQTKAYRNSLPGHSYDGRDLQASYPHAKVLSPHRAGVSYHYIAPHLPPGQNPD